MILSKSKYFKDSNEAEVVAILEALRMFVGVYNLKLVVKNDSPNAIGWVSTSNGGPWRFHFIVNESKFLSSMIQVEFSDVLRSVNALADSPVKARGEANFSFGCFHYVIFFQLFMV